MGTLPRSILADTGPLFALLHAGEDVQNMRRLMAKYNTMDLADASLVVIGERLGILDVVTLDRRDFSQYRTRARQAFANHFPARQ